MYWIFLLLFIIAVLVPDIIRTPILFLTETRAEEILIFLLGAIAFFVFIEKEQQLIFHRSEKEKDQKKLKQTMKDLVESYSYIGEVNRKMDLLMNIALGITDRSVLDQKSEQEIYDSIVDASNFLMKADCAGLRFINSETGRTVKEIISEKCDRLIGNAELMKIPADVNVKKDNDYLVVTSPQVVNNIKAFLVIKGYDDAEESNPKNMEILKVFISQAIFLHSYAAKAKEE